MHKGKPIEPGCLAILLKAKTPANVGCIVTILESKPYEGEPGWTFEFQNERSVQVHVGGAFYDTMRSKDGWAPANWLKRIDGDCDDVFTEETDKQLENA